MMVLRNGHLGQLYCGKRIHDREDFSDLLETSVRIMCSCVFADDSLFSLENIKQEYPVYGTTDYRHPAVEVQQKNGSRISDFVYQSHVILPGKPKLSGLPATYVEEEKEADTLLVTLKDTVTGVAVELSYTVFAKGGALARSARVINQGQETVYLNRAMSLCLDLPDDDYEWIQFSGAWGRERQPAKRKLAKGLQAVESMRGNSSHEQNPFLILKRPGTDEFQGEAFGVSLVYSGNFLIQGEVNSHSETRILAGIHPDCFTWKLAPGDEFQTPEAVLVYTDRGLNSLSQSFHRLYQRRLARGIWRDKERPILINNWEATYFNFTEEKLLALAKKAKECGIELFVLDDGWFGARTHERAGLGDWVANPNRLPEGITGIAEKIEAIGLKFGLWFEPEMVNLDSDLYRAHPDWVLATPHRPMSQGRFQHVLDYSRKEVVDGIYQMMAKILREAKVSYVKWDMNRSITECYSAAYPADQQGEIFHRYILGVYDLYDRLTKEFPHILFESCASGGGRFDPGMLYYAPQAWTSDDSDAVERLKIQYGTSMCYPISSMGSHVSIAPNHQLHRNTPLDTRANVAYFGTFGYELDLTALPEEEIETIKEQVVFMKKYRKVLQYGRFYRLQSPWDGTDSAWMVVNEEQTLAIVGWYRILNRINDSYTRVPLKGLNPNLSYTDHITGRTCYGDELMYRGLITSDETSGFLAGKTEYESGDYASRIYVLTAEWE
jgi:alpha-galactosidase